MKILSRRQINGMFTNITVSLMSKVTQLWKKLNLSMTLLIILLRMPGFYIIKERLRKVLDWFQL